MCKILTTISKRIVSDIRRNAAFLIIIISLWITLNLTFHHFCPLVMLCGFPCPGCGITRAVLAFLSLHPLKAFAYNPTYPLWIGITIAALWLRYVQGSSLKKLHLPLMLIALATLAVYIYRIIFLFPSNPPMTYVHDNLLAHIFKSYGSFMTSKFG